MLQGCPCGVAQTEAADHDIQGWGIQSAQPQISECLFHLMKQTRHEEGIPELDLVDLQPFESCNPAAAKRQFAQRRLAEVEFREAGARSG